MTVIAALGALVLIFFVLLDVFETIILPRRVSRRYRITSLIYTVTWRPVSSLTRNMHNTARREAILGVYGPLSLLLLLVSWVIALVVSFAVIEWSMGSPISGPPGTAGFGGDLYMSGTTFITLGLGDIVPKTGLARFLTVLEAGAGFGIIALVIGYLPTLYQAFSRREVSISLLDARAGSPPTAVELLRRHCNEDTDALIRFLSDWERWSAELLESHISYPALAYFRSQHEHQSWLAALTMILDACALILTGIDDIPRQQAELTFALARHAAVDLSQVFNAPPRKVLADRCASFDIDHVRNVLASHDLHLAATEAAQNHLLELRQMYEPYVSALEYRLLMTLPPWTPAEVATDDWQTSVWEHDDNHDAPRNSKRRQSRPRESARQ